MARRKSAAALRRDPDEWARLTPEQQQHVLRILPDLRKRVENEFAAVHKIDDPAERAEQYDMLVQFGTMLVEEGTDLRDDAIVEATAKMSREESSAFTQRMSVVLGLTPSRIRQIKSKPNIGSQGSGRSQEIQELLTRDYLETAYLELGMSQDDIAELAGCKPQTVSKYMRRYLLEDIERGIPAEESPFHSRRGPRIKVG